jgi:predicted ATPase
MNDKPHIEERLFDMNSENEEYCIAKRVRGELWLYNPNGEIDSTLRINEDVSTFNTVVVEPINSIFKNVRVYRIDPIGAKEPTQKDKSGMELDKYGHNLAAVLERLAQQEEYREMIVEFLRMFVPRLQDVRTQKQHLDSRKVLTFKEQNINAELPAHLISDGTVYLLALLVSVLDRKDQFGMTLIEEPERGLHPKAIIEIMQFIREQMIESPHVLWCTTHSESVVRNTQNGELWFVERPEANTEIRQAQNLGNLALDRDRAWLANVFGGGLP